MSSNAAPARNQQTGLLAMRKAPLTLATTPSTRSTKLSPFATWPAQLITRPVLEEFSGSRCREVARVNAKPALDLGRQLGGSRTKAVTPWPAGRLTQHVAPERPARARTMRRVIVILLS